MPDNWISIRTSMPAPHARYRVYQEDKMFDATPCYGLHHPWWVPRNGYTRKESEPIPIKEDSFWMDLPEPPTQQD